MRRRGRTERDSGAGEVRVQSISELVERRSIEATKLAVRRVHDYIWGPFPDADDPFYAELDKACEEATPRERMDFMMKSLGMS